MAIQLYDDNKEYNINTYIVHWFIQCSFIIQYSIRLYKNKDDLSVRFVKDYLLLDAWNIFDIIITIASSYIISLLQMVFHFLLDRRTSMVDHFHRTAKDLIDLHP